MSFLPQVVPQVVQQATDTSGYPFGAQIDALLLRLGNAIGFSNMLRIKNLLTLFSGVLLGMLLGISLIVWLSKSATRVRELGNDLIKIVKFKGKNVAAINPISFVDWIDVMLTLIWWQITGGLKNRSSERIAYKSSNRLRWLAVFISIFIIAIIILGLMTAIFILPHYQDGHFVD